jgi:CheY-like chemotaxis protein
MPGCILVVDDLPDPRSTIRGILEDAGYVVRSAATKKGALDIIATERIHVAILDVRLDEWDEKNKDGLDLMHEINRIDPAIAVIILTGYADVKTVQEALQPDNEGNRPAFGFLNKSEIDQLVDYVQRAFRVHVGLVDGLVIDDPDQLLPKLSAKLRFSHSVKPSPEDILDETKETLSKLFADCERIEIHPMQRGFSGVAVLNIVPIYRERGKGTERVVKIGERALIEKEQKQYETHVRGMGHRLPNALAVARTHSLAGILYTFAGMGNVKDFSSFFHSAVPETITHVVNNLYLEACPHHRDAKGRLNPHKDLRKVYLNHLRLSEDKLKKALENLTDGKHPFRKSATGDDIILNDDSQLLNPYTFALSSNLYGDYYSCTIHGDLYGKNILIDQHNESWLIDFETAGDGPILQDFASLENYVRLYLSESETLEDLIVWEKLLFSKELVSPDFPNKLNGGNLSKIHKTIVTIRNLAQKTKYFSDRAYLIALLFNAIKTTTFLDLSSKIREHALLSASYIAGRISKGRTTHG